MMADQLFKFLFLPLAMLCQKSFFTSKLIGGTWDLPGFSGATFLVLFAETLGNVPPQTHPGL